MSSYSFDGVVTALFRDGTSDVFDGTHCPVRVDGYVVGAPLMTGNAPHRGELHPDGDELLLLLSGRVEVILDDGTQQQVGAETVQELAGGQAVIVPKGVWHRINVLEPSRLVHVTPGPGDGHRPL
jgi:mannose-6-phosphate isomerase-like protein (cupin superfamily)